MIIHAKRLLKAYRRFQYDNYIRSSKWKTLRLKRLEKDDFQCTQCGSRERLQVHHNTYKRFKHEHLNDLQTLCYWCHNDFHKTYRYNRRKHKFYKRRYEDKKFAELVVSFAYVVLLLLTISIITATLLKYF